jgi:hypothetical protein
LLRDLESSKEAEVSEARAKMQVLKYKKEFVPKKTRIFVRRAPRCRY